MSNPFFRPRPQRDEQSDETVHWNEGGGRSVWRGPSRGFVKQVGAPPLQDKITGQIQANRNSDPVAWNAMFPNTGIRGELAPQQGATQTGAPLAAKPMTPVAEFKDLFASNQPARISPPAPMPASPEFTWQHEIIKDPPRTPINPASQQQQTPFGTITPTHTWQQTITAQYPEIGKAGSPQNLAFVKAFQQHGDPQQAMETAHRVMQSLNAAPPPSGALAHDNMTTPQPSPAQRKKSAGEINPYALR